MTGRTLLALATGLSLIGTAPAPAGVRPCRDASGRIISCPKVRKPSPRCKDAAGRFIACPPARSPADHAFDTPVKTS